MLFCCFEALWGQFTEYFSLMSKKGLFQKGALKYSENLFFLTYLKRVNPEENLDFYKQMFFIKPVKWVKYQQKLIFSLK